MNILIIGCGKVGSHLANLLSQLGHDVAIVDRNPESFDLLDNDFAGFTVQGIPIDQDVLKLSLIHISKSALVDFARSETVEADRSISLVICAGLRVSRTSTVPSPSVESA